MKKTKEQEIIELLNGTPCEQGYCFAIDRPFLNIYHLFKVHIETNKFEIIIADSHQKVRGFVEGMVYMNQLNTEIFGKEVDDLLDRHKSHTQKISSIIP